MLDLGPILDRGNRRNGWETVHAEQIISKLREAEIRLAQGANVPEVCRALEVSEQTFYRWRKEFGG